MSNPVAFDKPPGEPSLGELMTQLSEHTSRLVRDELQLAQVELKNTAKHAALGAGLFGAAGLFALFGLGVMVATAIIALALLLPWWLAGLIVGVVLFIVAAVAGLVGKKQMKQASPAPERTIENVKADVAEVKESRQHDHSQ